MKFYYSLMALFFVAGSVAECWLTRDENPHYYSTRDFRSSISLMVSALILDLGCKGAVVLWFSKLGSLSWLKLGYDWWVWILCYLIWDFIFYIKHYLEHNVRILWAIHVNHHSSPYMNLSTSLRSAVLKSSYRYFFWAVIVLIGFPLPMFLILYGIGKIWAFFGHSQVLGKWGWLEKFMITPTHHRLHHSCNADHLNSNFGETFLFWDRLFGTFKHSNEPLKYGIGQRINHDDFKEVVFHELRQMARELKDSQGTFEKVKILFGRPRAAVS